ncbi:unnamed protein product, partial [Urochloa humidicola]
VGHSPLVSHRQQLHCPCSLLTIAETLLAGLILPSTLVPIHPPSPSLGLLLSLGTKLSTAASPAKNPVAALNQKQIAGVRASTTLSATSSTFPFPAPWPQHSGISDPLAAIATTRAELELMPTTPSGLSPTPTTTQAESW